MTRFALRSFAGLALVLALASCGGGASGSQDVTIGVGSNGLTTPLDLGATLTVQLAGNPTTGYNWAAQNLDTSLLQLLGEPTFTPTSSATGSGGTVTLRFKGVGRGTTLLTLVYQRSFDPSAPPAQTFQVTVMVK